MPGRERGLFLFVGERPSDRAVRMGVTWNDGALAGATLFDALRSLGLDPSRQRYRNLYTSPVRGAATDSEDEREAVGDIRLELERGLTIVGMGRIVQRVLAREGIPHLQLRHPAARGRERLRPRYHNHAHDVLTQDRAVARKG
jgi:uracil-DNA glycosylase